MVIHEVGKKFGLSPYDQEELVSVGLIGLIKAIDTFNPDKEVAFPNYALKCIDNEIKMYIRKNKKYFLNDSLETIVNEYSDIKLEDTLYDVNADFVTKFEEHLLKEKIIKTIDSLDDITSQIIKLNFGFNCKKYTQAEIGNLYNLSQSQISKIVKKGVHDIYLILREQQLIEKKTKIKRS